MHLLFCGRGSSPSETGASDDHHLGPMQQTARARCLDSARDHPTQVPHLLPVQDLTDLLGENDREGSTWRPQDTWLVTYTNPPCRNHR